MEMTVNLIAIALYLLSCLLFLRRFKQYLVLFGFLAALQLWALVSCFYNDLGIYNQELFRFTQASYATSRLAAFYILFNLGCFLAAHFLDGRVLALKHYRLTQQVSRPGNLRLLVYALGAVVVVYEAYWLSTNKTSALLGVDKLAVSRKYGLLEQFLSTYGPAIAFLLGYYRRKTRGLSIQGIVLSLFVLFKLLTGHKFSSPVILIVCYFVPIYIRHWSSYPGLKIVRMKYITIALAATLAFLAVVFIRYQAWIGTSSAAWEFLGDRVLANQGQLWWAADNHFFDSGQYDKNHWVAEANAVFSLQNVSVREVGMQYLMVKILGPRRAHPILDGGYYYTMAYPAILIMTVPYFAAAVIQFLAGAFFVLLLFYLNHAIVRGYSLRSIVALILVVPFITVLETGVFIVFLTIGTIGKAGIILALESGLACSKVAEAPAA